MNQPYDQIMEVERIVARWLARGIGGAVAVGCAAALAFWIVEKYDCFPFFTKTEEWFAEVADRNGFYADIPQKAITLAVIGGGV